MISKVNEMHHCGVIVRDMEKMLPFYTEVLGFEVVDNYVNTGEQVSRLVVVPEATLHVVFLKIGDGTTLFELLEYVAPRAQEYMPANIENNDYGIRHVTFAVDDVDACYNELLPKGVPFMAPPEHLPEGNGVVYFKDPEGNILEFYQKPIK